jgi:hypothetical protein
MSVLDLQGMPLPETAEAETPIPSGLSVLLCLGTDLGLLACD